MEASSTKAIPPQAVLTNMVFGHLIAQSISVVAKLSVADHLKDGARNAEELAGLTDSHAPHLFRLLRTLTSVGVFTRDAEDRFSNNEMSEFLRSDNPASVRGLAHLICDYEHWHAHEQLFHSVKTGETAFDHVFGKPIFEYLAENPDPAEVFDEAMTSFSSGDGQAVAATYDFSQAETIADIAGGHGILLSAVLRAYPRAKGVLFDQPQVVEGAGETLMKAGVREKVETVGGNFFKSIPVTADVYLMRLVLHDWTDEQNLIILKNLAAAVPAGKKLLIIESVVEEGDTPSMSKIMDINMMALTGGRERTEREYFDLLEKAGFRLEKVHQMPSPTQIVEAVRV
jgi:hypothetical protein